MTPEAEPQGSTSLARLVAVGDAARPREWPASFADRLTHPVPNWRDAMKVSLLAHLRRRPDDSRLVPTADTPVPHVDAPEVGVTWVGHATFLLQIGGRTILTDPVWSDRLLGMCRRHLPPGVAWSDLPPIDAVVISHNHRDHLDAPTIDRLPRSTPVLAPAGLGDWFRRRGFTGVVELDWWESATLDDVELSFVPSHHWSQRSANDGCRSLWGGWVITAGDERLYFAGDTGWGGWFGEIGARYPGIDVAMLPVGAYALGATRSTMHLDPYQAVRACAELGAERMVPMHWGTFRLSTEPLLEPIELARQAWKDDGRAADDLWDLATGESRVWRGQGSS